MLTWTASLHLWRLESILNSKASPLSSDQTRKEGRAEDVHKSLLEDGFLFKTLTVKVRYKNFTTRTKAHTLEHYTNELSTIKDTSKTLLKEFIDGKVIRLIGVRLSRLEKTRARQKSMEEFKL